MESQSDAVDLGGELAFPLGAIPGERPLEDALRDPGALDLLALLPCPLKVPVEEQYRDFATARAARGERPFGACLLGQANHEADLARVTARMAETGEVPSVIVSPGLNAFFRPPFADRFLARGAFRSATPKPLDARLASAGLADPAGGVTVLAVNLLVLAVDEAKLAGRAVPRRLDDLFAPEWADSIAIRGDGAGSFCETLLLSVYRRHGRDGILRLARAVRRGWHPSQMVKAMSTRQEEAPAVSVLPLFFADLLRRRPGIRVIWPEDGAVVSPVTMLVRADRAEAVKDLVAFLAGPDIARVSSGASFPALHPDVPGGLALEAPLDWIGWDFVRAHDLGALLRELDGAMAAARPPAGR